MKVIVLGRNGQLGQCLSEQLLAPQAPLGIEVQLFSRDECDLTNFQQVRRTFAQHKPDVVINAAAYTAVDKAESEPAIADMLNHQAVKNLAGVCGEFDSVLVHISTDYVFDGASDAPYVESAETAPQSVYGKTKMLGERAICKSGCKHLIIRSAWIFSEHGANFLKTMLRLGRERNHVSVVNDQLGTPTYAQDLANAIIKTLPRIARNECPWGIYHYAGGTVISWYEFAHEIFAAATTRDMQTPQEISALSTAEYPTAAPRPACSALSTTLFSQTFGVQASDWHKGIQTTLAKISDQQADQ